MMKKVIFLVFLGVSISNSLASNFIDLVSCVESTLLNNPQIKKARHDFNAFKELENQSLANLLPNIGFSVSRSTVDQKRSDGINNKINQNYITESDALTLRQPVYRPRLLKNYRKAQKEVIAEQLLLNAKEDALKIQVVEVYVRILKAYEEENLLRERLDLLTEQKRAVSKSIEAGRGTITELAEIYAAHDKAVADLIRAEQSIKAELNELRFYTGIEFAGIKKLNKNFKVVDQLKTNNLQYWEEKAVINNYEIEYKRIKISAAELGLASEKFGRYPSIDFNIQLSRGSSESTFFVDSETKSSSLGLTFFLPLYQGGNVRSKIRQSASLLNSEIEGLRGQEEDLKKTVQKIYYGMQESIKLSGALRSAVNSATIELEANKKSAIAGVRRQLDVLISQQKLLGVEKELVEANLNIILYWLSLNKLASNIDTDVLKIANSFLTKSDL